jgi:hypothetical protein
MLGVFAVTFGVWLATQSAVSAEDRFGDSKSLVSKRDDGSSRDNGATSGDTGRGDSGRGATLAATIAPGATVEGTTAEGQTATAEIEAVAEEGFPTHRVVGRRMALAEFGTLAAKAEDR